MQLSNNEIRSFKQQSSVKQRLRSIRLGMLLLGLLSLSLYALGYFPGEIEIPSGVVLGLVFVFLAVATRQGAVNSNYKLLERYINEDPDALATLSSYTPRTTVADEVGA